MTIPKPPDALAPPQSPSGRALDQLAGLSPAYFGMVMATGIVSLAAHLLTYDPLYWGAVFPLGMYAVSTERMSQAMGFNFLEFLPPTFLCIALLAWTVVFFGLILDLARRARHLRPLCAG